jgi:hypothetical protein
MHTGVIPNRHVPRTQRFMRDLVTLDCPIPDGFIGRAGSGVIPEHWPRRVALGLTATPGANDTSAMTLRVPRLPFALDPLIAEAKRRARQRRFLTISALLLVVVATGLTLGLRPSGGSPTGGFATSAASTRVGELAVPIPPDFHRYYFRAGVSRTGARRPVIGVLTTDYRLPRSPGDVLSNWASLSSDGPPANRVALKVGLWDGLGVDPTARLHLPLSLDQPWAQEHFRNGARGYRWGYLIFHGQLYDILFWSGRTPPPPDRAAVLNMLASIHPAH